MNPTASSYVFWMFVVALVIYGLAVIWHVGLRRFIVVTQELPGQSAAAPYLSFAAFLVGLSVLVVIMEPVHIAFKGYDGVVAAWRAGLPLIVGLSATSGFLFGLTGTTGIIRAAVAVSLPSAAYTVLTWQLTFCSPASSPRVMCRSKRTWPVLRCRS